VETKDGFAATHCNTRIQKLALSAKIWMIMRHAFGNARDILKSDIRNSKPFYGDIDVAERYLWQCRQYFEEPLLFEAFRRLVFSVCLFLCQYEYVCKFIAYIRMYVYLCI